MKILGITGRSGSGKGYICALFEKQGIPVIDTDEIVHTLYRENNDCICELEEAFGALRDCTKAVDRKKLAQIVFADRQKLERLNQIVHRYVATEVEKKSRQYAAWGVPAVLIDAPQLFEAHLETICALVIAVIAPEALRISRICQRDGITEAQAKTRLTHQLSDSFFEVHADILLYNDGVISLEPQIQAIVDRINSE